MKYIFLIATILLSLSCKQKLLDEAGLELYMKNEKNGLLKKENINGFDVTIQVQPSDLVALRELSLDSGIDDTEKEKIINGYGDYIYFLMSISKDYKGLLQYTPPSHYPSVINTLSFDLGEFIYAVNGNGDTSQVYSYQVGQFYEMEVATEALISFEKESLLKGKDIKLKVEKFHEKLEQFEVSFQAKDLAQIPNLNFKIQR